MLFLLKVYHWFISYNIITLIFHTFAFSFTPHCCLSFHRLKRAPGLIFEKEEFLSASELLNTYASLGVTPYAICLIYAPLIDETSHAADAAFSQAPMAKKKLFTMLLSFVRPSSRRHVECYITPFFIVGWYDAPPLKRQRSDDII